MYMVKDRWLNTFENHVVCLLVNSLQQYYTKTTQHV